MKVIRKATKGQGEVRTKVKSLINDGPIRKKFRALTGMQKIKKPTPLKVTKTKKKAKKKKRKKK